jgi:threonine dehydratase
MILNARVYDVAIESPLELRAQPVGAQLHNRVLLKREDMQPVFSFKLRGAYNKMAHLSTPAQKKRGVIAPSPATMPRAWRWRRSAGLHGVIVMPVTTPQIKIDAVKKRGGEVVLAGDSPTTRPTATRWNWKRRRS